LRILNWVYVGGFLLIIFLIESVLNLPPSKKSHCQKANAGPSPAPKLHILQMTGANFLWLQLDCSHPLAHVELFQSLRLCKHKISDWSSLLLTLDLPTSLELQFSYELGFFLIFILFFHRNCVLMFFYLGVWMSHQEVYWFRRAEWDLPETKEGRGERYGSGAGWRNDPNNVCT
jgi:hypothetical protein